MILKTIIYIYVNNLDMTVFAEEKEQLFSKTIRIHDTLLGRLLFESPHSPYPKEDQMQPWAPSYAQHLAQNTRWSNKQKYRNNWTYICVINEIPYFQQAVLYIAAFQT